MAAIELSAKRGTLRALNPNGTAAMNDIAIAQAHRFTLDDFLAWEVALP